LIVTSKLVDLARNQGLVADHPIYNGFIEDLRSSLKNAALEARTIDRIIDSLAWKVGREPLTFPLYMINERCVFSMKQIMLAQMSRPNGIFERFLDTEIRGRYFEIHCRRLLRKGGVSVFPSRIVVKDYLPPEVSFRLWGSLKAESDIDVIGRAGRFLLVLECKEMKKNPRIRKTQPRISHEANILSKASVEIFYKAKWLSGGGRGTGINNKRLSRFLSSRAFSHVIPVAVTNQQVRTPGSADSAATISLGDLLTVCNEPDSRIIPVSDSQALLNVGERGASAEVGTPIILAALAF
jgi:hypothetical protein